MFSEGTVHSRTTGIPSTRYRSPAHQKRYIYSNGIFSFLFFSSLLFSLSPFFFEETLLGFSKKLRSSRDPCLRFSRGFVNTFRSQFFRTNSSVRNAIFKHDFKILCIYILRIGFFTFFFYGGKSIMRKISRSYPISSYSRKIDTLITVEIFASHYKLKSLSNEY